MIGLPSPKQSRLDMRSTTKRRLMLCRSVSAGQSAYSSAPRALLQQACPLWLSKALTNPEAQAPLPAGFLPMGFGGASTEQTPDGSNPDPSQRSRGE